MASRTHGAIFPPVPAFPQFSHSINGGVVRLECETVNPFAEFFTIHWKLGDGEVIRSDNHVFDLEVDKQYTLYFAAVRQLQAVVSCSERAFSETPQKFSGLSLNTNRRFDVTQTEVNGNGENPVRNAFTKFLFEESNSSHELSANNEWTIEFPLENNQFLKSVGASGVEQHGWGEIADAVLVLEYETSPERQLLPLGPEVVNTDLEISPPQNDGHPQLSHTVQPPATNTLNPQ